MNARAAQPVLLVQCDLCGGPPKSPAWFRRYAGIGSSFFHPECEEFLMEHGVICSCLFTTSTELNMKRLREFKEKFFRDPD
jgi:hypothetical protein